MLRGRYLIKPLRYNRPAVGEATLGRSHMSCVRGVEVQAVVDAIRERGGSQ